MGSLQEMKAHVVETDRELKRAQETIAELVLFENALSDLIPSLKKKLSDVRLERANIRADFDEMSHLCNE